MATYILIKILSWVRPFKNVDTRFVFGPFETKITQEVSQEVVEDSPKKAKTKKSFVYNQKIPIQRTNFRTSLNEYFVGCICTQLGTTDISFHSLHTVQFTKENTSIQKMQGHNTRVNRFSQDFSKVTISNSSSLVPTIMFDIKYSMKSNLLVTSRNFCSTPLSINTSYSCRFLCSVTLSLNHGVCPFNQSS